MNTLPFYQQQSFITDPKALAYLYDPLPCDVGEIKSLLQGLILHFWDGRFYDYQIPMKRLFDVDIRYVDCMLQKIMQLDHAPLVEPRSLDRRLVGSCRDYATLLCSVLRYQGIPARTRVAFSAFYFKEYNHDEVILEYWSASKQQWLLVDPRVTEAHIERQQIQIDFDLLDVPRDQLIVAGLAWKMVRKNPELANAFCGGDRSKNKGMWYIRDRLVQDIAALNGVEMLLWDMWGLMFEDHALEDDEVQLQFLDHIAELSIDPDKHFEEMRYLYQNDARLTVPRIIKSVSPLCREKAITLAFDV